MYNTKKLTIITAIILTSGFIYSASLISSKSFFTPSEMKFAVSGEFLTSVILKGKGDVHSYGVENTAPVKNSYFTASFSDFDMVAVEKGFFYMNADSSNKLKLYRYMTDFSALKGMIYYSKSQGENSILILDSYKVQYPDDVIKKNTNNTIPESSLSHFAVKDNRLGLLTFKSELFFIGENFIMINTSTGASSKFGMKILYPGDYLIYKILIYDKTLKGYFFYTAQYMKVRSSILSKFDLIKPEIFGNRVRAENIHFLKSIGNDRSGSLAAFK